MKPILIIRFVKHEGPGFLATFLDAKQIPWQLVKIDQNEPLPTSLSAYSGLVLMGGPMSANDDLPWINLVIALAKQAYQLDLPMLGHCLGGQLISHALGAKVTQNVTKEIGWHQVIVAENEESKTWFGEVSQFNAFHWHGETFSLPAGATHLLSSKNCLNQAYSLGKHLVLQAHVEVTPDMIKDWCDEGVEELASTNSPVVQSVREMQDAAALHCFFLNKVASQLYGQWIKSLMC